jgi:hypothetical protein
MSLFVLSVNMLSLTRRFVRSMLTARSNLLRGTSNCQILDPPPANRMPFVFRTISNSACSEAMSIVPDIVPNGTNGSLGEEGWLEQEQQAAKKPTSAASRLPATFRKIREGPDVLMASLHNDHHQR